MINASGKLSSPKGALMKTRTKSLPKRTKYAKTLPLGHAAPPQPARTVPRCTRCGSRTVRLEKLNQELLAVLAVHCLICGHHAFIGKPMVRLIRKPEIPDNVLLKKEPIKV